MALFAFVGSITPGPNNMMLLASGVNFGFKRTIPHILGVVAGFYVMLLLVGAGLEKAFTTYPILYQIMKVVGFGYLLFLAWIVATNDPSRTKGERSGSRPMSFMAAVLFQWVNPKAWLMAIACFSTYMPPDASPVFILMICTMFGLINLPCVCVWAISGSKLESCLRNDRSRRIFNWLMAIFLIVSMLPVLLGPINSV